jgi:hypothetical protein
MARPAHLPATEAVNATLGKADWRVSGRLLRFLVPSRSLLVQVAHKDEGPGCRKLGSH